jgi:hypothetical protein
MAAGGSRNWTARRDGVVSERHWLIYLALLTGCASARGVQDVEPRRSFEYALAGAALGMVAGAVSSLRYAIDSKAPNEAMAFFGTVGGVAGLVVGASKQEWKPIYVRAKSGER